MYIGSFRVYRQIGIIYKYMYNIHTLYTYSSVTADRLRRQTQSAPGLNKSATSSLYRIYIIRI